MLLLSPLTWLVAAAGILSLGLGLRVRWLTAGSAALVAVSLAGMTPLVANALVARMERPGPVATACEVDPPSTIVALAGGLDGINDGNEGFGVLNLASRRRVERAVAIWHEDESRFLVLSGASRDRSLPVDAELMAGYARVLGVPHSAISVESRSLDTWENARLVADLRPSISRRITLVTSGMHMRRARFAFEVAGFQVCPMPTDSCLLTVTFPGLLLPRSSALRKTEQGLHEAVGLAYYRWWRARSGAQSVRVI